MLNALTATTDDDERGPKKVTRDILKLQNWWPRSRKDNVNVEKFGQAKIGQQRCLKPNDVCSLGLFKNLVLNFEDETKSYGAFYWKFVLYLPKISSRKTRFIIIQPRCSIIHPKMFSNIKLNSSSSNKAPFYQGPLGGQITYVDNFTFISSQVICNRVAR